MAKNKLRRKKYDWNIGSMKILGNEETSFKNVSGSNVGFPGMYGI